ncbi:MAG: hypothetical protein NVSMB29_14040 [Candidatus Dormibacteria bacterium]
MVQSSSLDPDRLAPDATNPSVSDVMRDEVIFCLPSTPVDAVAKLMADNDLDEVPVLIDRRPVGYVIGEDIVRHLADGKIALAGSDFAVRPSITEVQVRDILRTPPLLVDEHQRVHEVIAVMGRQGRRLALVMHEDETPVGMLTPLEVAGHLAAQLEPAGAVRA